MSKFILFLLFLTLFLIHSKKLTKKSQETQSDPFSTPNKVLSQYGSDQWSTFASLPRSKPFFFLIFPYETVLADINGDGVKDIVGFGANSLLLSFATDNGFSTPFTNVAEIAGTGFFLKIFKCNIYD